VLPSVAALLRGQPCDPDMLAREVAAYADGVSALPARIVLAADWIAPPRYSDGVLALDERWGLDGALRAANLHLARALRGRPSRRVLNAEAWQRALGDRATSAKNWYLTKDPYTLDLWKRAVASVKRAVAALSGGAKKLILLDLDNTLWGGEVGDAGVDGVRVGGHDPSGEAYRDFQRELAALARRGTVLGIVSRNDEALALEAIDTHPEMVLRRDDFAGWAIDWNDKAANVRTLCSRIGIAPADAVFIDDNPGERAAVSAAIPELLVPAWPANPMLFVEALRRLDVFDVPEVTDEDLTRARSYVASRAATDARADARIDVRPAAPADIGRVVQLLNKTNQMNLTTRRLTDEALRSWLAAGDRALWTVRVSDAFADYGLTGVLSLDFAAGRCEVADFVMSCRVISRGVEERMLAVAREQARDRGAQTLVLRFVPTARNQPMRRFLVDRSGLHADADGVTFGETVAAVAGAGA
jgi:FkbH-like protein